MLVCAIVIPVGFTLGVLYQQTAKWHWFKLLKRTIRIYNLMLIIMCITDTFKNLLPI